MSGKPKKIEIKIDVTDWSEEYDQDEVDVSTFDALMEYQRKTGAKPQKLARLAIISRERGDNKEDILRPNKLLLLGGGAVDVASQVARAKTTAMLENGNEISVRKYVAQVRDHDWQEADGQGVETDMPFDNWNGPELSNVDDPKDRQHICERARSYLLKWTVGHIVERLKLIAVSGGDFEQVAEALKAEIDRVVAELK